MMKGPSLTAAPLAQTDDGRFSRETAAGYDRAIIERRRIIVVGCGALGQFIALDVALIGFPDVIFVDMDNFEESNISRSPFYRQGWNKARAVAVSASQLCTAKTAVSYRYSESMVQWLGDALFTDHTQTLVFSAVDSQPARQWLAQRCRFTGVPLIEGGFRGERWNVSVFPNTSGDEPCWACDRGELETHRVFSCDFYAHASLKNGLIPATAPGAMALAAYQVGVAVALLHDDRELANSSVFGDLRAGTTQLMRRLSNPRCRLNHSVIVREAVHLNCGPDSSVQELLREAERLMTDPVVMLPDPFIRHAPCRQCHQSTVVNRPTWAMNAAPLCEACGGEFTRSGNAPPEQHGSLAWSTSESILEEPLGRLGLGPGLHLTAAGTDRTAVLALNGSIDERLAIVDGSAMSRATGKDS